MGPIMLDWNPRPMRSRMPLPLKVPEIPGKVTDLIYSLGIYYPRGATVGGSSQVNAMNLALPPDNDWRFIAELTGDNSWQPSQMRKYFVELERNGYLPPGMPGHGYNGYIEVGLFSRY